MIQTKAPTKRLLLTTFVFLSLLALNGLGHCSEPPVEVRAAAESLVVIVNQSEPTSRPVLGFNIGTGHVLAVFPPGRAGLKRVEYGILTKEPAGDSTIGANVVAYDRNTGLVLLTTDLLGPGLAMARRDDPGEGVWTVQRSGNGEASIVAVGGDLTRLVTATSMVAAGGQALEALVVNTNGRLVAVLGDLPRRLLSSAQIVDFLIGKAYKMRMYPSVVGPSDSRVIFEIEPRLKGFGELRGEIKIESQMHESTRSQIQPGTVGATVPVAIGQQRGSSDGTKPDLRATVTITDTYGNIRGQRRFKIRVADAGWGSDSPPLPQSGPAVGHVVIEGVGGTRSSKKKTLSDIAGNIPIQGEGDDGVVVNDQRVEVAGRSRLVSARYEGLPVGPIRSSASRFDALEHDFKKVLREFEEVEKKALSSPSDYSYTLYERAMELQRNCFAIDIDADALGLDLVKSGVCRCSDGKWYTADKPGCRPCIVPDFTRHADRTEKCRF